MKGLLLATCLTGCASITVQGPGTVGEVSRAITVVARVSHTTPETFGYWLNPAIITYEPVLKYGPNVTGYTEMPRRSHVLRNNHYRDTCSDALIHELIHTALWVTTGDPDRDHTNRAAWKMQMPRDVGSWENQAKTEVCDE